MTGLFPSLAAIAGILLAASAAGFLAARALVPPGRRMERIAWGFLVGLLLLAGFVAVTLAVGGRPGWLAFAAAAVLAGAAAKAAGRPGSPERSTAAGKPERGGAGVALALRAAIAAGVLLYFLRALTEPMWAADFLAIWGWKGKVIFGSGGLPSWTWTIPDLGFTHPEYPAGLPLVDAGAAFLLGRWDDHALALLFPAVQAATLLLLAGWLERRGARRPVALAASAALALFEPLYRAFTTGMAEVPLSFFLLALGTSLADAVEEDPGGIRRLALAALGAAALKNEGLFAAVAAALVAAFWRGRPRGVRTRAALAAILPALAAAAAHRLRTGPLPLRDFRTGFLFEPGFAGRLALGLETIGREVVLPAGPLLAGLVLLFAAGRRSAPARALLALAALPLLAYALLPAFCVWGPDWLVRTAFARTASGLAPLAAAALALRLSPTFPASSADAAGRSGGSTGSAADPAA
jgi:hypothetical protein